jgi:hypothetical protein
MKTVMRLVRMTPEEISKLPYPETAFALGGIMMPFTVYDTPEEEAIAQANFDKIRQQFKNACDSSTSVIQAPDFDE